MWLTILIVLASILFLFWSIKTLRSVSNGIRLIKMMDLDMMEISKLGKKEAVLDYLYGKLVEKNRLFVWKIIRVMRAYIGENKPVRLIITSSKITAACVEMTDEKELTDCLDKIKTCREGVVLFPARARVALSVAEHVGWESIKTEVIELESESKKMEEIIVLFLRMAKTDGGRRVEFLF